jgi:hypothetical protein
MPLNILPALSALPSYFKISFFISPQNLQVIIFVLSVTRLLSAVAHLVPTSPSASRETQQAPTQRQPPTHSRGATRILGVPFLIPEAGPLYVINEPCLNHSLNLAASGTMRQTVWAPSASPLLRNNRTWRLTKYKRLYHRASELTRQSTTSGKGSEY